jgi:hypothetical protein
MSSTASQGVDTSRFIVQLNGTNGAAMVGYKQLDSNSDSEIFPASSVTKTICCKNSGVILGRLEVCIFEGHLAYFEAHSEATYTHPFYRLPHPVLLKKLEDSLKQAQEQGWVLSWREQQRMQLLMSAIMHELGVMKQEGPSLPKMEIAAGSAGRLLALSKWFFFLTSQRVEFPQYSINKKNENLGWENYKYWLDAAFHVRENWAKKARTYELDAKKKAHEEALKEIKDDVVYKRLDMRRIWNWIEIQLVDHHSKGRIETFKNLFLNGDLEVYEWTTDDVDDLIEATVQFCDQGNDIMFFIRKRLQGMLALQRDLFSSFMIVGGARTGFQEEKATEQEEAFIAEYDKKVEALEELPPKPNRESFATQGLFMRAEAQWNILARRFKAKKGSIS